MGRGIAMQGAYGLFKFDGKCGHCFKAVLNLLLTAKASTTTATRASMPLITHSSLHVLHARIGRDRVGDLPALFRVDTTGAVHVVLVAAQLARLEVLRGNSPEGGAKRGVVVKGRGALEDGPHCG